MLAFFGTKPYLKYSRHLGEVPSEVKHAGIRQWSLYRGPQHEMNSWREKMEKQDLTEIETNCEKTLREFGYTLS